jgi:HAD superfamily hydrolase (TIGR01509 family)
LSRRLSTPKIQAVLFDLDGVLVDACDWHYEALNRALKEFGYPAISRGDHVKKYNGLPTKVKLRLLGIDSATAEKINHAKQQHTLETIREKATPMREKIELHAFLMSRGIKIACVTNSIRETASKMLECTGQMEYISLLVTNEDVANNKPSPDCYNLAIERLGIDKRFSVCVEDSPKGIEAAKASGIRNLWCVPGTEEVNKRNFCAFMEVKE